MSAAMKYPVAVIRTLLIYDPATGLFRWRDPSPQQPKGWFKGTKGVRNYRRITFDGDHVLAHVVAWTLMTGEWPSSEIDHRDRDQGNNKWANLRPATHAQNAMNRSRGKNNTTGEHGVSRFGDRFRATIGFRKKRYSLGLFDTIADAAVARRQAERKLYGDFRPQ